MSWHKKFLFLSSILVLVSTAAFGQAAQSPFSAFAMGEPYGNSLIQNQGMAGTGVSQPMFWSINHQNPALLVYNYYTSFQAGALVESRTFRNDTASQRSVNGNLNYLAVAFPVMRHKKRPELMRWSTSVSLMPFSKSNYKIGYVQYETANNNPSLIDTLGIIEQGSGGLSHFSWGNGIRLTEELAIGVKAGYVFGSTVTDQSGSLLNTEQSIPYVVAIRDRIYVRDFIFTGGFSYVKDSVFRNDMRVAFGATYTFPADMRTTRNGVFQRRDLSGTPITSDTTANERGSINMPSSFTAGISIAKGAKWSVGTEFTLQDWSKFENINDDVDELSEDSYTVNLQKSWRVSLGGELTPDQGALTSYFKRVTYRVGLSYEQTPYAVNGAAVNDLGINFGFSLPAGRSSVDWAFRVGKRGNISDTAVEESYFKIFFGITFNDQWFYQRKID
jgi:hypothetical protein